jgi:DNA transformation protein and related proteins
MVARKTKTSPFVEKVLRLLLPLGPVHAKAMFGGYGLSLDGSTFAIITRNERLFFKVDDESRAAFAKAGGKPFTYQRPTKDGSMRAVSMSYCEAPDGTLTSAQRLLPWAERGVAAAKRAAQKKSAKKRRA